METIWQPLTFIYEGQQRKAKVKLSSTEVELAYHVIMDDGYENEFFIPVDANK